MQSISQLVFDAASLGALYALAALGIGLVFGVMRLVNFAYGEYITYAGYALLIPMAGTGGAITGGMETALAVVIALAAGMILAVATERIAFRPLRDANPATLLITSFAVSYFLQNLVLMTYGSRPQTVDFGDALTGAILVAGARLNLLDLATLVVGAVLTTGLWLVLQRTELGIQLRAASENFGMARLLGVRANRIIAAAFALSGLFAAFVALLVVAKTGVLDYRMGVPLVLMAFIGTVIGGLGNIFGAALGGFLIGAVSMTCQHLLPIELRGARDAFVFAFVVVILVLRPRGLIISKANLERI